MNMDWFDILTAVVILLGCVALWFNGYVAGHDGAFKKLKDWLDKHSLKEGKDA